MRLAGLFSVVIIACTDPVEPRLPDRIAVTAVVTGLELPLHITSPSSDDRLFIVERDGLIKVMKDGQLSSKPFLDVRAKVTAGGERGLLGLAFHPRFAENGYLYVNYTDVDGNTRIERYHTPRLADFADHESGTLVLSIVQPFANHNGGMLLFGLDGMLWIGTGDGGGGGDPFGHAQNPATLLGKMLRIDVDGAEPYGIPANNPYAAHPTNRREIWGVGLRNPWRYAFDRLTGMLYVADVGQESWEEVHVVPSSRSLVNYGWNRMEGRSCFGATMCDTSGLDVPVLAYGRDVGCSVTGGVVYRGNAIPGLRGHYLYSDACSGFLRSFRLTQGHMTDERVWDVGDLGVVTAFGEDTEGEVYLASYLAGVVYRIDPATGVSSR